MNITMPKNVQFIIDTFYENGYEAFMVGGCIRDILLNKTPTDYDIATSAPPEVTERLFTKTIPTGIQHGTVTVVIDKENYEVTTYRLESEYINNRKPSKVIFVSNIKEDLSRRDFTINAFAYNDKKGLIDYFQGNNDLNLGIIKCVGIANKRFNEDALRMLRAIRFSCQLNFDIEKLTYEAIEKNAHLISNISHERIRTEFSKILLSNNAYKGLSLLKSTGILNLILSLETNINPSIDSLPKDLSTRLSFILLNNDLNEVNTALRTLTFDNSTIKKSISLLSNFDNISDCDSKYKCKKLIISVGKENIYDLISLYSTFTNTKLTNIELLINDIISNNDVLSIKDLNINGTILKDNFNLVNGKVIGELLSYLLDEVLKGNINNSESELLLSAKKYYSKIEA